MNRYELQLNPQVIFSYILKRILKIKREEFLAQKNNLKIRLSNEKKAFAVEMELRPCFYKLRPRDIEFQLRHKKFKLLAISNTKLAPDNYLKTRKGCIYSTLILSKLQDTAFQYKKSINNKFLTTEFIKNREQNILITNYKFRLRLRPRCYESDLIK